MSLKSVQYVILSMTLLHVTATLGIVTTTIGSKADVSAGCPCNEDDWITEWQRGTEFCVRNGHHSRLLRIILAKSFCARSTHISSIFPYKIVCGNPTTTFSVTNLQSIAAAS
jgi:hypothetical protein